MRFVSSGHARLIVWPPNGSRSMGTANIPPDAPGDRDDTDGGAGADAVFAERLLLAEEQLVSNAEDVTSEAGVTPSTPDPKLRRAEAMLARLIACGDEAATEREVSDSLGW